MDADIGPKVERVFYNMLSKPYHGRVKFTHLSKMSPRDFTDDEEVQAKRIWFEENSDTFALFRNGGRKIVMCGIKVKEAKLCEKYLQQQLTADGESKCEDADCSLLHLCMGFLDDRCTSGECKLSHSLDDDHNKNILKLPVFRKFSQEDQIKIIRLSQPEVCLRYNEDGICNYKDECTRLHVCKKFLLGKCNNASDLSASSKVDGDASCKLSHKLTETHSLHLLQTFGVWYNPNNVPGVRCQILAPKMTDKRNKKEGKSSKHIGLDADFFERFRRCIGPLNGLNKDEVLPNEETFAKQNPSVWSVELFDTWFDFDAMTNERIESSFCDPNSNGITVRTSKEVLELIPECQEMTLTFDENTSLLDDGQQLLPIRRLVPDESNFDSIYLWYYLDKDNQWSVLDQNDVIETDFNNKEKRVNINFEDGRMFRLKFEDMTLKDRNDGDVYKVRRRPVQIK